MSDQFLAEIRIFPFNFPPTGWAFCDGQLMPISQNTALFSLLGTTYGGDGKSTFALPDLQGNTPMQQGQGAGLQQRMLGELGGVDSVTLLTSEMPAHNHALRASVEPGDNTVPSPQMALGVSAGAAAYVSGTPNLQPMSTSALPPAGGSVPHTNMQPYLTMSFCVALQGIFPSRP